MKIHTDKISYITMIGGTILMFYGIALAPNNWQSRIIWIIIGLTFYIVGLFGEQKEEAKE